MGDTIPFSCWVVNNGEDVLHLFHEGYLTIDNIDISNRKRPKGLHVCCGRWKNSK